MANTSLFIRSNSDHARKRVEQDEMVRNAHGATAYRSKPEQALLHYAFTGTLSNTFYMSERVQLDTVLELCNRCEPEFVAKVAVAARQQGLMKDMPAMLLAYLNARKPELVAKAFNRVIDQGKMLRKFTQIVRSNVTGRRGFGSITKRTICEWLDSRTDDQLMYDAIGGGGANDVSLEDIIRMVRPKPKNARRSAMYAWIRGAKVEDGKVTQLVGYRTKTDSEGTKEIVRTYEFGDLPEKVQLWETYRQTPTAFREPPKIPYEMLAGLSNLTVDDWEAITRNMTWQQLRQNLENLQRKGVFDNPRIVEYASKKLRSEEDIKRSRCLPYQLLATYLETGPMPEGHGVTAHYWQAAAAAEKYKGKDTDMVVLPKDLRYALEDAMEIALSNVPSIPGQVYICPDTSGSMGYPITGTRQPSHHVSRYGSNQPPATKVRCVDVAGLITAAILRQNPTARALPFSTHVHNVKLKPMETVLRNAVEFTKLGGGGTACSAPLRLLNEESAKGEVVIFISDYESWSEPNLPGHTPMMAEWNRFKVRNPKAKLICIDLAPRTTQQVANHPDILHIGGFSDNAFWLIDQFVSGRLHEQHWTGLINQIAL